MSANDTMDSLGDDQAVTPAPQQTLLSADLGRAIHDLECKFRHAETEIYTLDQKLDKEFALNSDGLEDEVLNPAKALQRLQHVKQDFSKLKEETVELQRAQHDALEMVKREFEKLAEQISKLEGRILPDSELDEATLEQTQKLIEELDSRKPSS